MSIADGNFPIYNASEPNGGDPLTVDVNLQYKGIEFQYVYQTIMGCFVFLIIPGIGMLYGGLSRRKSALSMIFQSITVMAVVGVQWMFWGYSLAFSRDGGPFIGTLQNFLMWDVMAAPSGPAPVLPEIVFCFYEVFFCGCATMIVVGGAIERGRVLPSMLFGFLWATVVYCPIAYWTWNPNGWLFKLPGLDFAGGGPVHVSSGSAGLAYALVLGKRKHYNDRKIYKPHNVTIIFIGTVLIWFGWFGFNGGSALNASMRAMVAVFNTHTSAGTGAFGAVFIDWVLHKRKFSVVAACEGAICGLVGITPAAGFVNLWSAALIGFVTAAIVSSLRNLNEWIGIDDGLEVFKNHGIGGMVGGLLTGIFATQKISRLDGVSFASGAIDGNGVQFAKQIAEICAIASYSFVCSCIMLYVMNLIPGLSLRCHDEAEDLGVDIDQFHDEIIGEWDLWEGGGRGQSSGAVVIEGRNGETPRERSVNVDTQQEKIAPKSD